ncbi:hypothetical protein AB6A40_011053 [Gnathostoma spinigerum]|uniref:Dihydroorotate dehydrogenase catalytic domain-containing protein n=1 Tax=Gnathostoma spinigerum TaxID=75299 RepID=A0ABD6EWK7_9BILA
MLSVTKAVDLNSTKLKRPKVFLKIAPDLVDSDKKDIAKIALDKQYGVDGLIVSNTTISRPDTLLSSFKAESGGLSGKPLKDLSTECIREMYKYVQSAIFSFFSSL